MMQTYKVSTDKSGAQKTLYSLLSKWIRLNGL
jgi:hypothetical protein